MERDYGQELDQLKEQMEALRQEMATQVGAFAGGGPGLPSQPTHHGAAGPGGGAPGNAPGQPPQPADGGAVPPHGSPGASAAM